MKQKIRPEIFLRAKYKIENGHTNFCCTALKQSGASDAELWFFTKNFKPELIHYENEWFGDFANPANKIKRIQVLSDAAKLAKEENKSLWQMMKEFFK